MLNGFVFAVGSCIGSFLQVIMDRFLSGESWIKGRSHCMNCHKPLKWWMMIPIASWIFLKGKCYYCKSVIPFRHVMIEILFGSIALFCFIQDKEAGSLKFGILCILFLISYFDLKTMRIEFIWIILLMIFVALDFMADGNLSETIWGSISVSGIMILLNILKPNSIGQGDIQLMMICGALLGMEKIFEAWLIGNICAGVQAIYLLLEKKAKRISYMPYAPSLCIGVVYVLIRNML